MDSSASCPCGNHSSPVHYGDTVLFYLSPEGDDGEKSGYCMGLMESLIVYPASKEKPVLPNIRSATFRIVAAQGYEAEEKFRKLDETLGKSSRSKDRTSFSQAKTDFKLEEQENINIQARTATHPVYYDTNIQHVTTNKFIAVYTKRPSETEHKKLKVYTQRENGAECIFKVVRKLTLQCNMIHYCDELKLESLIIKGYYLDCSKTSLPIDATSITKESYEVNLAANAKSSMTVFPHDYAIIETEQQDTLNGGSTVCLVQPRCLAYIEADKVKDFIDFDVSFKKQEFSSTLFPNKHWQFEIWRDPKSGQPILWDEDCQIKLQTTYQYLSVSKDDKVELLKCIEHYPASIKFKLNSVLVKSSDHVKAGDNFHIFHVATETYLHFPDDPSGKFQWKHSKPHIEALKVPPNNENAFIYEKVEDIVLDRKNEVMDILTKLMFNIDGNHFKGVLRSIKILHDFMKANKKKVTNFINLIRHMKILPILFQYYKKIRSEEKKSSEDLTHELFKETRNTIFEFTSDYLKRDKKENQSALLLSALSTTELHSMLSCEDTEKLTLELMAALVKNNQKVVTKNEDKLKELIGFWFERVKKLNESIYTSPHSEFKDQSEICSMYLTILSSFCECNGIPLRKNQERILGELKLVDTKRLKEELKDYTTRPWLKDEGCYELQAAFFKFIVKYNFDHQKLLPAYQSQFQVFQHARSICGRIDRIICWELAEVALASSAMMRCLDSHELAMYQAIHNVIQTTPWHIYPARETDVAESEEGLDRVLQKDIVENYEELRKWIMKEFRCISRSNAQPKFLETVLNVMNLALDVEHYHMLQKTIQKARRRIPLNDSGNRLDSSYNKVLMAELVKDKLGDIRICFDEILKLKSGYDSSQVSSIRLLLFKLIDKCYSGNRSILARAESTHLCIARSSLQNDLNDIKSVLRQVKVTEEDKPKFKIWVQRVEEECYQFEKPNAATARKRNQHILESSGILSEILLLLSKGKMVPKWLNSECFKIITAVSYENVEIQERLLNYVEVFLKHSSDSDYGHQIGQLFFLIFSGSGDHRFTLAVKEKYTEFMLCRIFSYEEKELKRAAEFTAVILACMKINSLGLPIQHNQVVVIKIFSSMREDTSFFLKELLNLKGICNTLEKFIEDPSTPDGALEKTLMMTDILASCSEGHHTEIEAVCSTIYKLSEIIDVVLSLSIPLYIKRPFIRFLTWVYIATDNTHQDEDFYEGLQKILNQQEELLQRAIGLLEEFNGVEQFTDHYLRIKHHLNSAEWKFCHKWSSDYPESQSSHQSLTDHILYIIEGVIPFIDSLLSEDKLKKRIIFPKHLLKLLIDFHSIAGPEDPVVKSRLRLFFPRGLDIKTSISCILKALSCIPDGLEVSDMVTKIMELEKQAIGYENALTSCSHQDDKERCNEERCNEELRKSLNAEKHQPNTQSVNRVVSCARIYDSEGNDILELPSDPSFKENINLLFSKGSKFDAKTSMRFLFRCIEDSLKVYKDAHEMRRVQQERLDIRHIQLIRGFLHNHVEAVKSKVKTTEAVEYRSKLTEVCLEVKELMKKLLSRTIPLLNHPCERVVLELLALLNDILYMLNYGYKMSDDNPSHTNGWADPHELDLVSLLKVNNNYFLKEIMKKLKQSAIFYDLSQYLLQERTKPMVQKPVGSLPPQKEQKTTIEIEHYVNTYAEEIPFTQLTKREFPKSHDYLKSSNQSREDKLLELQDTRNVTLIMNILSKMCDGQKTVVQDYLRDQKGSTGSDNIVAEVTLFMKIYMQHEFNNKSYFQLIALLFRTLLEMCVGNFDNKKVIFDQGILNAINSILRIDMDCAKNRTTECASQHDILLVKSNALELLKTLVEQTSKKSGKGVVRVDLGIDPKALNHSLKILYKYFKTTKKDKKAAEQALFTTYHILLQLGHHPGLQNLHDTSGEKQDLEVWDYCKQKSLSVEIVYSAPENPEEQILSRVYFQTEYKDLLRPELQEFIKWSIDRTTAPEKLRSLMSWIKYSKRDILHHHKLHNSNHSLLRPFVLFPVHRYWILLFLTFLMNILVLVNLSLPAELLDARNSTDLNIVIAPSVRNWFYPTIYLFGILHFIFAFWMAAEYILVNIPHFVVGPIWMDFWKRWLSKIGDCYKRACCCYKRGNNGEMSSSDQVQQKGCIRRLLQPREFYLYEQYVLGFRTLYILTFVLCSFLAFFTTGYLYCICLFYIIENNDLLQRAIKSISRNGFSLLWVAALILVWIYVYSVLSFVFFHQSFADSGLFCTTLSECFVTVLRVGLIDNLGNVIPFRTEDFQEAGLRLLLDISFFVIITTIFLSVTFSIILDAFSATQEERLAAIKDMKSTCFICSLERDKFDHIREGFANHVGLHHNMWAYFYYYVYLDRMDPNDRSAIETYIYGKMDEESTDFLPVEKALDTNDD